MKLIVGLGNKGQEYQATRHNVGFMVLDRLAGRHQVSWNVRSLYGIYGDWQSKEEVVRFLHPNTMMNRSGEELKGAVENWDVKRQDILIVCDDVNLPLGTLRVRPEGSDGGHHGLASCLQQLGTEEVPRLRVGVGIPSLPNELTDFVLSPFEPQERPLLEEMLAGAAEACELWATRGIEVAMNHVNVRRQAGE